MKNTEKIDVKEFVEDLHGTKEYEEVGKMMEQIKRSIERDSRIDRKLGYKAMFDGSRSLIKRAYTFTDIDTNKYNESLFGYLFTCVVDEYIKDGFIKVENGKTYFCNPNTELNQSQEFEEVIIGLSKDNVACSLVDSDSFYNENYERVYPTKKIVG